MKFFVPDWDDRIDPGYDFLTERSTLGRHPQRDDVYAHEFFDEPCYDGVLVSRSALAGPKEALIRKAGLRRFLRLPDGMELIGDCGAFGYIEAARPTYETGEVLQFYQDVGVDYGVSVDHIIFPAFPDERDFRYRLTIDNAAEFLQQHRAAGFAYEPVGAVQGWDVLSYQAAAQDLVRMGYRTLAIGGLVRSSSKDILAIVRGVAANVGSTRLHLLGVARDSLTAELLSLGIYSFDSASPIRTAWMSATKNYVLGRKSYTAIRVPFSSPIRGVRNENVISRARTHTSLVDLERHERKAMRSLRAYEAREIGLPAVLAALRAYDAFLTRRTDTPDPHDQRIERYRETLADRPWAQCRCHVCRQVGIEVVIFRGSNRNRRRGFHNVLNFYRQLVEQRRTTLQRAATGSS